MKKTRLVAILVFLVLSILFTTAMVQAQNAPPPAPQGVPCLHSIKRWTTFSKYNSLTEDRAILATTIFSLPVDSSSCVATYEIIYGALTGVGTFNPTLECFTKDRLTEVFGYCTGVISGTARVDFFVSQKFHGGELIQIATDTEMTWKFDASRAFTTENSAVNSEHIMTFLPIVLK